MKGIILAGGTGSRLFPLTLAISKQILPVYNKPMIYYPLSILMLAGIKDILIISTKRDKPQFEDLLGCGKNFGINISYVIQEKPEGLAQAYILAEDFLAGSPSMMMLGDNIIYGAGLREKLTHVRKKMDENLGAYIFAYEVSNPSQYGIVTFDKDKKVKNIIEKPEHPESNYAVIGLYVYDGNAPKYAKMIKKSSRGELEITSLNNIYLQEKSLNVEILGRGYNWFDTGTHDSLLEASEFVKLIEHRQGLVIGSPEEIAYRSKFIAKEEFLLIAEKFKNSEYGKTLLKIAKTKQEFN